MTTAPAEAPPRSDPSVPATTELDLSGMHCGACASRVERALARAPGVTSASVNLATHRAYVAFDPSATDEAQLCRAVHDSGYGADVVRDAPESAEGPGDRWRWRAAVSWPLSIGVLVVAFAGGETAVAGWTQLALALIVEVVGGWPFLRDAAKRARHGATNMDTLIALGTLAALAVSVVEAVALDGRHLHAGAGAGAVASRLHGAMAPVIISILASGRAVEGAVVMRLRERRVLKGEVVL